MRREVRLASVTIDTLLLVAGASLWALLQHNPLQEAWLATKLALLVVYVVLGSFALKRARSQAGRLLFLVAALSCAARWWPSPARAIRSAGCRSEVQPGRPSGRGLPYQRNSRQHQGSSASVHSETASSRPACSMAGASSTATRSSVANCSSRKARQTQPSKVSLRPPWAQETRSTIASMTGGHETHGTGMQGRQRRELPAEERSQEPAASSTKASASQTKPACSMAIMRMPRLTRAQTRATRSSATPADSSTRLPERSLAADEAPARSAQASATLIAAQACNRTSTDHERPAWQMVGRQHRHHAVRGGGRRSRTRNPHSAVCSQARQSDIALPQGPGQTGQADGTDQARDAENPGMDPVGLGAGQPHQGEPPILQQQSGQRQQGCGSMDRHGTRQAGRQPEQPANSCGSTASATSASAGPDTRSHFGTTVKMKPAKNSGKKPNTIMAPCASAGAKASVGKGWPGRPDRELQPPPQAGQQQQQAGRPQGQAGAARAPGSANPSRTRPQSCHETHCTQP